MSRLISTYPFTDLSSLTARPTTSTPAQSSSTITEITSSATVTQNQQFSSSTTLQTSPRSPVSLGSTESHQSLGSISSTTTGSQQSTRSTFASTSESQRPLSSASLRTTAAHQSPSSTSFPSPPISDFQTTTESPHSPRESYGYFNVIAKDRRPLSSVAAIATLETSSNRQCGHVCLTLQTCRSFSYNKLSCLCSLYSLSDYSSTEILTGTHLYKRLM